jgi:hypothetical protein
MLSKVSQELRGQNRRLETDMKNINTEWLAKLEEFVSRKEIDFESKKIADTESSVNNLRRVQFELE